MGAKHQDNRPENHRKGRRCWVVMVAYPLQGHFSPMLQLATLLHSKGFSIAIAYPSEINPPNPSIHSQFTYLPLKADGGGRTLVGPTSEDGLQGVMGLTVALNKSYKGPFENGIKELMKLLEEGKMKIGCIIYDIFMYFAQSVADYWNIPGISLSTSCAASILGIVATPGSHELGYNIPLREDPELQALELDTIVKQLNLKQTEELLEVKAAVITALSKSTAILVNSMGFMERAAIKTAQKLFLGPIYPIGPFHKHTRNHSPSNSLLKENPACIAWLDQHPPKSVVYVSFGSLASMTEGDIIEIATGLAQSDQPFLWVVRPGMVHGGRDWAEILPPSLKERIEKKGFIVGWAPQRQVLSHDSVGGFWTHCGWNSTIEGVCEGVPMICRPFFGDQFLNAKYISKVWKIGLELDHVLERGNIERTLRKLMVGYEAKEMRKRALDLKEQVDLCLKEGGSSHNYVNQLVELIASF